MADGPAAAITEALYQTLIGDPTLAAMLDVYDGKAAVFTTEHTPTDYTPNGRPYIVTPGFQVFGLPWTLGSISQAEREIAVVDPADGSNKEVQNVASYVAGLLESQYLVPVGVKIHEQQTRGPTMLALDPEERYGQQVNLTLLYEAL